MPKSKRHDFAVIGEWVAPGARVLDLGCGDGGLLRYLKEQRKVTGCGVEIEDAGILACVKNGVSVIQRDLEQGLSEFQDGSFDCVLSLNTIHNFPRPRAITAMREIQRLSGGRAFVQVDSYHTPQQKEIFESWVLTAEFHDYPQGWVQLFEEAGYTGDYYWTIIE